jgi:hypothetical protein
MNVTRPGWRLFCTCWIVYSLHFATNTVREIYPALSLADYFSLRVDEYAGLHPDLFEMPGRGWHINSNPGASMLAAVPYAVARPAIDAVVQLVNNARRESSARVPEYQSPWPMAREFFEQAWLRGLDVKFGLAALVIGVLCMAPLSAAVVVLMFGVLRRLFREDRTALAFSLLFALGTPLFFRTGTLNHNLLLGHFAFAGFVALWNPGGWLRWSESKRVFLAGAAAGAGVLMDYSGVVFLAALALYTLYRSRSVPAIFVFAFGALGPLCLLWLAQWQSFGHPFLPAQHWMPRVAYSDQGFSGFSLPRVDLLWKNAFDYRFGLFTSAPVLLLALVAPWLRRERRIPKPELFFLLASVAGLWIFASAVQYAYLQFNTGVRYMAPACAFLFVPAAMVLRRFPPTAQGLIVIAAIAQAWCLAMYRDVERGLGVLEPVVRVFTGGLQLPALTVLSRMDGQYADYFRHGASPLPIFLMAAAVIYVIWRPYLRALPHESNPIAPRQNEYQAVHH